jgi:predicted RND superfamily exporter protein
MEGCFVKSPDLKQLKSLGQVLVLHQQQLDLIQAKFQKQDAVVSSLWDQARQLKIELEESQQVSSMLQPNASSLQIAMHCVGLVQSKIMQNENDIEEATSLLETIRNELRVQVSKKDALENFVSSQTKKLEQHRRTTEQHVADEQYLSRLFAN